MGGQIGPGLGTQATQAHLFAVFVSVFGDIPIFFQKIHKSVSWHNISHFSKLATELGSGAHTLLLN